MSNVIGLPIIKIINKDTGDLIREISVKNTTTAHLEFLNSPNNLNYIVGSNYNDRTSNNKFAENDVNAIYTLPFIKTKSRRFSGGSLSKISFSNLYDLNGEKYISYAGKVGSETGFSLKIDDSKKALFTFHGALAAPSGTRSIGTIGVIFPSYDFRTTPGFDIASNPVAFTPLEEIIVQDSTMIVDITYNLIVDFSDPSSKDYGAIMEAMIRNTGVTIPSYYKSHSAINNRLNAEAVASKGVNTTCVSYEDNESDKYLGYLVHTDLNTATVSLHKNDPLNFLAPALKYDISLESIEKCGDMIGAVSSRLPSSTIFGYGGDSRRGIQNVKSGRKNFTVYEKTTQNGDVAKPFLDIQNFKKGSGSITVSGTKQKWLPERWDVEVVSDGPAGVAKFKVRKNYVSSYAGNTNNQIAKSIPHLSPNLSGPMPSTQFNHKYGVDLTFKSSMFKLWDFNIALVSRKAAAVTLATDNKYVVFDNSNLIPNNGNIMLNGLAWDVNTKELILSCQNNGLYRISKLDMNTDQTPVITKVEGVGKIYAITSDGFGGIGIVTDDGIKFSKNLAKTWAATITKQECTTSTGFEENGFEKISLMMTDFKSPDFKTAFVMSALVDSGKDVWISTSEKAGTRAIIGVERTSSFISAICACSYYLTNNHITKILESWSTGNLYNIAKLFFINAMPQSLGYVSNGLFNIIGYGNSVGESITFAHSYNHLTYKESSTKTLNTNWGREGRQAVIPFNQHGEEDKKVFFSSNESSNGILGDGNSEGSYTRNHNHVQDIYYNKDSEAFPSILFVPARHYNNFVVGVGGEDYSIFRSMSTAYTDLIIPGSFDVDNIPALYIAYETYISGSVTSGKTDSSFYIKYAKKTDGSFSSFIKTTSDAEEFIMSGETEIDGVKISVSPTGEFKTGDVYSFIRYDGVVNDNLTTGVIKYETSSFDLSEEMTHSGTVSYEAPKSLVKFNIIDHFDARVTRDGYIKSESDGAGFASSLSQSLIYGDFKLPINIDNLNGVFAIEFLIAPINNISGFETASNGYTARLIVGKVNNDTFYTFIGSGSIGRNPFSIPASTIKTNALSGKTDLHVEYDGKTRVFRFMSGTQELARTSSHNQQLAPVTSVYMYSFNTSLVSNGNLNLSFMPRMELTNSGGTMITGQSVMKIPEFREANGNVLCTILGNRERSTGYYDPKFIAIGGVPGSSIIVEIDGKPATVLMNKDSSSVNQDKDFKTHLNPRSLSTSQGYESSLQEGQVYVDHTAGLVLFSNDDKGRPYTIKYKYYKDNKFGIDEVANE